MSAIDAPPRLSIRRKSTPREEQMSPIDHQRDLEIESRLSVLETIVADIHSAVTSARPQLAIISLAGSGAGSIIVGVIVWYLTNKK